MADSTQNTVVEFTGDFSAPAMPKEIAKAIIQIAAELGPLEKDDKHENYNYEFASIDAFISHVRDACNEAKLGIIPQEAGEPRLVETRTTAGKPLMMWWSRFGFILFHDSGATYGPIYKTVMVQAIGAQAAGSAQSYALKQLMRGLFLIPTGDKDDPDKTSAEISAAGEQKTDLQKTAESIQRKIKAAKTLDGLIEVWGINEIPLEDIREKSQPAYDHLGKVFEGRKKELKDA